ncbi:hypothetical protein CC80DRAFT_435988 [Byssothecium circinans]|uniref:Nudix hydrolase domain-containing protein n=1 Tax=Byssothecium circinans TaxID=147558 RepID=A0A6A5UCP7_9PLEO|nr:hypothetical protein CC80DRAFT_435988 [Byssothecium circinans]
MPTPKIQFTLSESFHNQPIPYPIPVRFLCDDLTEHDLVTFPAFRDWFTRTLKNFALQDDAAHALHSKPLKLQRIDVESVTWFPKAGGGRRVGFMKLQAQVQNYDAEEGDAVTEEDKNARLWIPGAVFLRGGSVGVLILIKPYDPTTPHHTNANDDETYTILTIQPRLAAASLAFPELPAGMLDGASNFSGTAAQEVREETGLVINSTDMFNMSLPATTGAILNPSKPAPPSPSPSPTNSPAPALSEDISSSMYPSPGACDEFLPLFLVQKRMTRARLDELRGRATGLRQEGEIITVKVVPFRELWREGSRDGKALAALGLYYSLREEGMLPEWPGRPTEEDGEAVDGGRRGAGV